MHIMHDALIEILNQTFISFAWLLGHIARKRYVDVPGLLLHISHVSVCLCVCGGHSDGLCKSG